MSRSTVSRSPRQRSGPQAAVHSASAARESQEGVWTPLVTYPTGTSTSGHRGNSAWKIRRLTWPCRRLTPLTAALPRTARYAMLNGSSGSSGSRRPRASSRRRSTAAGPSASHACRNASTSAGLKRSKPAGTGVWVVKTLPARVTASATSKGRPVSSMKLRARSSTAKAA